MRRIPALQTARSAMLLLWRRHLSSSQRYPSLKTLHKPTLTVSEFWNRFKELGNGTRARDQGEVVLCGRIEAKPREASKKLFFYHIRSGLQRLQILAELQSFDSAPDFTDVHRKLKEGDIVSVRGFPGKTKKGELSLVAQQVSLLTPCLRDIPSGRGDGKFALSDKGIRYRQRHLDLLANGGQAMNPFIVRAQTIRFLRRFLEDRDFVEVETPIIAGSAGGALAQPFKTKAKVTGDQELSLRIAPELYLKKLVIGGMDRVFEIGKVFRNEGVSPNHNPEFTSCEFYWAYADYTDLMKFTEDLLRNMALEVIGTTQLPGGVDLAKPFKQIDIVPALESAFKLAPGTFPDVNDVDNVDTVGNELCSLLEHKHPGCTTHFQLDKGEHTVARNCKLVDEMISMELEPSCVQPTFLCNHPLAMSPLAKEHPTRPGISQRFELFIYRKEVVNAYTELNDPSEQMKRFQEQLHGRELAQEQDVDVMPVDAEYCKALEYGLPPTAGWGMGIDRIVMMLTGKTTIRDVILFPMVASSD